MNNTEKKPGVEINASIMNFFGPTTIYTMIWPVNNFLSFTAQAGYDGLEIHPLQLPVLSGWQLRTGVGLNRDSKEVVKSMHQSWRGEKNLGDVMMCRKDGLFKLGISAFTYLSLSEKEESLSDLDRFQKVIGKKLADNHRKIVSTIKSIFG